VTLPVVFSFCSELTDVTAVFSCPNSHGTSKTHCPFDLVTRPRRFPKPPFPVLAKFFCPNFTLSDRQTALPSFPLFFLHHGLSPQVHRRVGLQVRPASSVRKCCDLLFPCAFFLTLIAVKGRFFRPHSLCFSSPFCPPLYALVAPLSTRVSTFHPPQSRS